MPSTTVEQTANAVVGFEAPSNPPCPNHNSLCAFDAADEARCPFCHSSWKAILRSDWHSCETALIARQADGKRKVALARQMRAEAAQRLRDDTLTAPRPHLPLSEPKATHEALSDAGADT